MRSTLTSITSRTRRTVAERQRTCVSRRDPSGKCCNVLLIAAQGWVWTSARILLPMRRPHMFTCKRVLGGLVAAATFRRQLEEWTRNGDWRFMAKRALLLLLIAASTPSGSPGCTTVPSVPVAITKAVETQYPGWSPVKLADLGEYERNIWAKKTSECPGIATGRFLPQVDHAYAIALVKRDGKSFLEIGIVYWTGSDQSIHSRVFAPSARSPNIPVIWKLHERRTDLLDQIVWEVMEVGSSAYSWKNDRFIRRILSY